LGNYEFGAHAANNGIMSSTGPFTMVSYSGNRYAVREGQEAGALTNAPSGTTADNTWWLFAYAGGVQPTIPAWVSGMGGASLWSGGAYHMAGLNQGGSLISCYSEGGQGPCQIFYPCVVFHGNHGVRVTGSAPFIHAGAPGGLVIETTDGSLGVTVKGNFHALSQTTANKIETVLENQWLNLDGDGIAFSIRNFINGVMQSQQFTSGGATTIDNIAGWLNIRKLDGTKAINIRQQTRPGSPALADVVALLDALGLWA
jgi:hypothetical protein